MMNRRTHFTVLALCLPPLLAAGCSDAPEATYSVQGTITYQGRPVPGGTVLFDQIAPGKSGQRYTARGRIDNGGHYQLSTFGEEDGAVAGRYRVAVAEELPDLANESDVRPPPTIPLKYSSPDTSGLEFEVKPESNVIDIDIE